MQNYMKTIISAVQTWTEGELKSSVADWNQNDFSADDYIKNRTHYEEEAFIILLPKVTVSITNCDDNGDAGYADLPNIEQLHVGETYLVTLNGVKYICVARKDYNTVLIGNGSLNVGGDGNKGNGEPFYCDSYDDGSIYLNADIGEYTISISSVENVVHKLDEKYLPDNLAHAEDVQEAFDVANNAQSTADTALTNASTAKSAADIAQSTANEAKNAAVTAQSTANEAKNAAVTAQSTANGKMDSNNPVGIGSFSMNRLVDSAIGDYSYVNGYEAVASSTYSGSNGLGTVSNRINMHSYGKYNAYDDNEWYLSVSDVVQRIEKNSSRVYYYSYEYEIDQTTGLISLIDCKSGTPPVGSYSPALFGNNSFSSLDSIVKIVEIEKVNSEEYPNMYSTYFKYCKCTPRNTSNDEGKYISVYGNGTSDDSRSNAHTLDWDGNAWYAGDVYVGSNSGVNKDDGSKKLASEEYVDAKIEEISGNIVAPNNDNVISIEGGATATIAESFGDAPYVIEFTEENDDLVFPEIDATLTKSGVAADAKVVGDEINQLSDIINNLPTGSGGISVNARNLLISILRAAVYSTNQSANIVALEVALGGSGESGGGTPDINTYTIRNELINIATNNSVASVIEGGSYIATLTANDGYNIDSVTVMMGGIDVTNDVYSDGIITITSVVGNVEIVASAIEMKDAALVTDGLLDFFDLRTATYNNAGTGGTTTIDSSIGNGQLFGWANNCIELQDAYGIHQANTRQMLYDKDGGTTQSDLGTAFTIVQLTYAGCGFGVPDSNIAPKWSFKPQYINSSGNTLYAQEKQGNVFNSDSRADYNFIVYRVDGSVLTQIMDTSRTTYNGSEIDGFASWLAKVHSSVNFASDDGFYTTAFAVYNRALSDTEIENMREYYKTLEVNA